MIKTFIFKKPIEIQAVQWTGDNRDEIVDFVGKDSVDFFQKFNKIRLIVCTCEADYHVNVGDWIIRGVYGEFYPCKPDIFEQAYEEV